MSATYEACFTVTQQLHMRECHTTHTRARTHTHTHTIKEKCSLNENCNFSDVCVCEKFKVLILWINSQTYCTCLSAERHVKYHISHVMIDIYAGWLFQTGRLHVLFTLKAGGSSERTSDGTRTCTALKCTNL